MFPVNLGFTIILSTLYERWQFASYFFFHPNSLLLSWKCCETLWIKTPYAFIYLCVCLSAQMPRNKRFLPYIHLKKYLCKHDIETHLQFTACCSKELFWIKSHKNMRKLVRLCMYSTSNAFSASQELHILTKQLRSMRIKQ